MSKFNSELIMKSLSFTLQILGIFGFSIIIGFLVRDYGFTSDTLKWFASTTAQTFGALLGIIVAVGIYRMTIFESRLKEVKDIYTDKKKNELDISGKVILHDLLTNKDSLWSYMYYPIQFMFSVIIMSLLCLSIANSPHISSAISQAIIISFLLILSFITLMIFLYRLSKFFASSGG